MASFASPFTTTSKPFTATNRLAVAAVMLTAGSAMTSPAIAGVQPTFTGIALAPGMLELKPVGIAGSGADIAIPFKAIKEEGVQVYDTPGLFELGTGTVHELPVPLGPNGEFQNAEIFQFRQSVQRGPGDPVKGIDVGLIKKPTGPVQQAAVWNSSGGIENTTIDFFDYDLFAAHEARSLSVDGSVVVGTGALDLSWSPESKRALRWTNSGDGAIAQEFTVPPSVIGSEARGTSADGSVTVGIAYKAINEPRVQIAAVWNPSGECVVLENTSPDMTFTSMVAVSDQGNAGIARAVISTTRSGSKAGLAVDPTGTNAWNEASLEFTLLDAGDLNGDGMIDLFDDHDSAAQALSADGSVVGGSITLLSGEQSAALWTRGPGGGYTYQDVASMLDDLGVTSHIGWTLSEVTGVSSDGLALAGWGTNPMGQVTGWAVSIPTPGSVALLGFAGLAVCRRRR